MSTARSSSHVGDLCAGVVVA